MILDNMASLLEYPRFTKGMVRLHDFNFEFTDSLSFYWEIKDIFEEKIYHFRSAKKDPFIIDAGGCIGASVLYFKRVYPEAKVISFEPDPNVFAVLSNNIASNKMKDITLVNAGLGLDCSKISFYADGLDGGSIYENINGNREKTEIKLVKLSDYMDQEVDLLKMNIEGAENEVFQEIESKLSNVKEIIFEYHNFYNLPQSLGHILNILDRNGFRYVVTNSTSSRVPIPMRLPTDYRYFNLVYAKRF